MSLYVQFVSQSPLRPPSQLSPGKEQKSAHPSKNLQVQDQKEPEDLEIKWNYLCFDTLLSRSQISCRFSEIFWPLHDHLHRNVYILTAEGPCSQAALTPVRTNGWMDHQEWAPFGFRLL